MNLRRTGQEYIHLVSALPARERVRLADPTLVDAFCSMAAELFDELAAVTTWNAVIADEPELAVYMSDAEFDAALEAIADFVDVKSPYTLGHSRGVAELAKAAARNFGLPADECKRIRRASLVHDLGRLGVSNAIWDKPGALTPAEFERVRAASLPDRADPRGGRHLPDPIGATAASAGVLRAGRGGSPSIRGGCGQTRQRCDRCGVACGGPARRGPQKPAGRPHSPRGRGAASLGAGAYPHRNRRASGDFVQDRPQSCRTHLSEDRRFQPRVGEPLRRQTRLDR